MQIRILPGLQMKTSVIVQLYNAKPTEVFAEDNEHIWYNDLLAYNIVIVDYCVKCNIWKRDAFDVLKGFDCLISNKEFKLKALLK